MAGAVVTRSVPAGSLVRPQATPLSPCAPDHRVVRRRPTGSDPKRAAARAARSAGRGRSRSPATAAASATGPDPAATAPRSPASISAKG